MNSQSMQNVNKFIGRQQELAELQPFLEKKIASLLVIKGRHRVGKRRIFRCNGYI